MIKIFLTVAVYSDSDELNKHTFCFNYGPTNLHNFSRAVHDYLHNHSFAQYIELNVDGNPVYQDDIIDALSEHDDVNLNTLFLQSIQKPSTMGDVVLEKNR